MTIISQAGKGLSLEWKRRLRPIQAAYAALVCGGSLDKLAVLFHSDKNEGHFYTQHYETHFRPLRRANLRLVEIGIGGNENPRDGGASLRMWKAYFRRAQIYGIDIHDKRWHDEHRIKTFRGSQADSVFLHAVIDQIGAPDIVIDDGSHRSEHVIKTFTELFPRLADGGYYVVEDLQTSYWAEYGGNENEHDDPGNSMAFFKSFIHGLNHVEYRQKDYVPNYYDKHITAVHFYHNMVFIRKGMNNEPSYVY